ncbi:MAG: hypothetical protein AAGD07_21095, partial [Planctomycetota bacterium]
DAEGPQLLARLHFELPANAVIGSTYAIDVSPSPLSSIQDSVSSNLDFTANSGVISTTAVPEPGVLLLGLACTVALPYFQRKSRQSDIDGRRTVGEWNP